MMLFKYKSFRPFDYIVDILAKNRLFASKYSSLNDPMEGQYLHESFEGVEEDMDAVLKSRKQGIRICSLSEKPDDTLMWSHYADGHKGIVVGLDIDDTRYDVRRIRYDGLAQLHGHSPGPELAKDILSHKLEAWKYEREVRVFVEQGEYVDAEVKLVVCGRSMSTQNISLMKEVLNGLSPNVELVTQPGNHDLHQYT